MFMPLELKENIFASFIEFDGRLQGLTNNGSLVKKGYWTPFHTDLFNLNRLSDILENIQNFIRIFISIARLLQGFIVSKYIRYNILIHL